MVRLLPLPCFSMAPPAFFAYPGTRFRAISILMAPQSFFAYPGTASAGLTGSGTLKSAMAGWPLQAHDIHWHFAGPRHSLALRALAVAYFLEPIPKIGALDPKPHLR